MTFCHSERVKQVQNLAVFCHSERAKRLKNLKKTIEILRLRLRMTMWREIFAESSAFFAIFAESSAIFARIAESVKTN
ncbi:hypothetical protein ACWIUD_06230 [Helicobacter sp. 23-1044]